MATAAGSSGVFVFTENRPTVVVVDDAGNAYQIDCPDADWFLDKLLEQVGKIDKSDEYPAKSSGFIN